MHDLGECSKKDGGQKYYIVDRFGQHVMRMREGGKLKERKKMNLIDRFLSKGSLNHPYVHDLVHFINLGNH